MDLTATFLLTNPAVVQRAAPWCVTLDSIELGVLLVTQPWIAGDGLRRAEVERRLSELACEMPLGQVYFQRVNRAVARLEQCGCLLGAGSGRHRGFVLAPQGFAAMILNLQFLDADPTLDGTEFEMKRELVATWNLMLEQVLASPPEIVLSPDLDEFFATVDALSIWGRPVITRDVVRETFDVLRLIDAQRGRVATLKREAEVRLAEARIQAEVLRTADLSEVDLGPGHQAELLRSNPELLEMIRSLAMGAMPRLSAQARISRYEAYLTYLDDLATSYARELKVVDIDAFRRRVAGHGG